MRKKLLVLALAAAGIFSGAVAQAEDSPFMVRVRGVYLNWENGQSGGLPLASGKIEASKQWIPEIDFTYFFTKNIAAELVLTYPQDVKINLGGDQVGTIKALPPSLVLQYHFTDLGQFKPYVGLGINYTIFTQRDNILNGAAKVDSSSVGVVAQVGMDYMLDKHWGVNMDVKWAQMATGVKVGGDKVGTVNLNPWMFGAGVTYRF